MMGSPKSLFAARGVEYLAMGIAILGLGGASGMTWRTINGPIHARAENAPKPLNSGTDAPAAGASPAAPGTACDDEPRGCVVEIDREEPAIADPVDSVETMPVVAAPPASPPPAQPPKRPNSQPRGVRVGDENGRAQIARVYGGPDSRVVLLPDGRLGWPNGMVYTDEPFRPLTADELTDELKAGDYKHFRVHRTDHYVVFYTCSPAFAIQSGRLLESLYHGLLQSFREMGIEVHESEFPLVAVVFRNEGDFREHKEVAPEVQAYYEVLSNRIFFYETRESEPESPEIAAMRKPQTVAHEGTHQILQNIGVQPRLARWPIWLVEGLAEFCSPSNTIKGGEWAGFGKINPLHLATIHDLEDSLAIQGRGARVARNRIGRAPCQATVEYLLTRESLTPSDYSLSWALTQYLAARRCDKFIAYLKTMSRMPPLVAQTPEGHAEAFRRAFGDDQLELSKSFSRYVSTFKRYETLPYYALTFEQPLGAGFVRRGTIVSQSPLMLRQWLDEMAEAFDAPYVWQSFEFPGRAAAFQAAEQWLNAH